MADIVSTVGTASRNYSTLQAWEDALPASAITAGNNYIAELYKDSEFLVAGIVLTIAGVATDATHTLAVRAAAGHSFRDNANVRTNALRYNAANGVAIRGTGGYNPAIEITVGFVTLDGLQIAHTNNGRAVQGFTNTPSNITVSNCLLEAPGSFASVARFEGINALVQNTAVLNTGGGTTLTITAAGAKVYGCTLAKVGAAGSIGLAASASVEVRNTVAANFTTCFSSVNAASASNNASTDATASGTGSLTGLTLASLFVAPDTDYRTKAGAALINAGGTYGPTTDISGLARPQGAAYDIGAWEVAATGGATDTSINPGAAAVTLTGFAPTVARTASQSVTPASTALVLTGYAPTVTQSSAATITPNPATLVLTGYAPTVARTASLTLTPAPAQLTLTGFAPTVTQVSASKNLTPAPAALVLTGFSPSVTQTGQQTSGGGVAWLNAYDQMHRRRHRKRRDDDEIKQLDVAQRTQTAPIITINPEQYIARMKKAENMVLARENAAYQRFVADLEAQASAKARALQEDDDEVLLLLM